MTITTRMISILLTVFLSVPVIWGADRVRVDTINGVPMITVDGKPVRSRIFFGGARSQSLQLTRLSKEYSFEFAADADSDGIGTLHFRFDHQTGTVLFSDISLIEVKTGRVLIDSDSIRTDSMFRDNWKYWPLGADNTTTEVKCIPHPADGKKNAIQFSFHPPKSGNWPDWHLYSKPQLNLKNGELYRLRFTAQSPEELAVTFAVYKPGSPFTLVAGRSNTTLLESQVKLAADAGVDFVSVSIPAPWPKPGEKAIWNGVEKICDAVLCANPKALLIPRFGLDPPSWWCQEHPEELMSWVGNDNPTRPVASMASPLYRKLAMEHTRDVVRFFEEKYGPSMAGYHPCGQNTGEWFYQDTWRNCYSGYSKSDLIAWRQWLSKKYPSDKALQMAWNRDKITCSTAEVPSEKERFDSKKLLFLDRAECSADQQLIDFNAYQQDVMVDTVMEFARIIREASEGKRMVVVFFGYVFEFGAPICGPAVSGHYGLQKALASPDVDIYCSPISYYDRQTGGTAPAMTAAESVALAGKMWLYEDDTRTFLTQEKSFPGWRDGADSCDATRTLLLRNTAECAVRNFGSWWMDLGMSGWFNDERLWIEMKNLAPVDNWFLKNPTPFQPQIAAFIDEPSMMAVPSNRLCRPMIYEVRSELGRIGAPFGQYLLTDYLSNKTKASLNVFINPWIFSTETRKKLAQKAAKDNCIWGYGAGYLDEKNGGSFENIKELTGFTVKKIKGTNTNIVITEAGKAFGLQTPWGMEKNYTAPEFLFAITDAKQNEILATYPDGQAAIAIRKRSEGGSSLFVGFPRLGTELLRAAARSASVHLYTQSDCNVYANGPFVILHAAETGPITIDFGKSGSITDIVLQKKIGDGQNITLSLKKGETKVLKFE